MDLTAGAFFNIILDLIKGLQEKAKVYKQAASSVKILKEAGIVTTRQRVTILQLLRANKTHPDVDGMYQIARKRMPSISVDTVYRTLNLLADHGVIQRMAVPTRRARFDGSVQPHDHFLCSECQSIADISSAPSTKDVAEEVSQYGEVHSVQTVYIGVCHLCKGKMQNDYQSTLAQYEYVV